MTRREILLDGVRVADDTRAYLIAEIGNNHQGKLSAAHDLIMMAQSAGASAVKFQVRDNRALYARAMFDEPYDSPNSFGPTYGLHREAVELSRTAHRILQQAATRLGITWFATPFDFGSADFLAGLDVPMFKIASGDLTNLPLMRHVASFGKPMIVSTGGADIADVDRAVSALQDRVPLCVMQCTSAYPAASELLNLRVIQTYRHRYPSVVVGYSGHGAGNLDAVLAYALGARVIEKHVTLDQALKGTDQRFSLTKDDLRGLVETLAIAWSCLGSSSKRPHPSEAEPMRKMQKALYAARNLPAGHVLTADDIAIKSPGCGLPPYLLDEIIGLTLLAAVQADEPLSGLNLPLVPLLGVSA